MRILAGLALVLLSCSGDGGEERDAVQIEGEPDAVHGDLNSTEDASPSSGGDGIPSGDGLSVPVDAADGTTLDASDAVTDLEDGTESDGGPQEVVEPLTPGTGFEDIAVRYRVPASGLADGFFASAHGYGARGWVTLDLDGDGGLDLVQTADTESDNGQVWRDGGGPFWKVYRGRPDGFELTHIRWEVPESGLSDGFFSAFYGYDTRYWYTLDLDGDRRPELIQSADAARRGGIAWRDETGPYWKVWRSSTSGFSGEPVRWRLPDSGLEDGFYAPYAGLDSRHWTLLDVDLDRRLDLVQTADPEQADGMVWRDGSGAFWKVWRATSSGFEPESSRLPVPDSGLSDGFFAAQYQSAAPGVRFWSLLDLDGDSRADLVQTADPTLAGGKVWRDEAGPYWLAFLRIGQGFSTGTKVRIADSGLPDGFFAASYMSAPSLGGERFWLSVDLDGDGRIELVQTADPEQPGGFVFNDGEGYFWRVWRPLRSTGPERWSVPSSGLLDGFFAAFWTDPAPGLRAWFLGDLDGDGRPDLVQTADPNLGGLYVLKDAQGPYWRLYRGR